MGSKTINWCDRCGEEGEEFSAFWFGQPSEFKPHPDSVSAYNELSLCPSCLDEIKKIAFSWGKRKTKSIN